LALCFGGAQGNPVGLFYVTNAAESALWHATFPVGWTNAKGSGF
jgi:hypothetical protein